MSPKDLELIVHVLQEAFTVIDDHDPDRNPARCMRQLRRLFDNINVRAAIRRLAAEIPLAPEVAGLRVRSLEISDVHTAPSAVASDARPQLAGLRVDE